MRIGMTMGTIASRIGISLGLLDGYELPRVGIPGVCVGEYGRLLAGLLLAWMRRGPASVGDMFVRAGRSAKTVVKVLIHGGGDPCRPCGCHPDR
jgi:hypothetical protein